MKKSLFFFIFLSINFSFGQEQKDNAIYILDDKKYITSDYYGNFFYIFSIPSKEEKFICDSFRFIVPNQKNFEEKFKLSELTKKIDKSKIDSKRVLEPNKLFNSNAYEIHELLSLSKKIYFISEDASNCYNQIEIIYDGTMKNLVPNSNGKL